jgi:hypothetical protein
MTLRRLSKAHYALLISSLSISGITPNWNAQAADRSLFNLSAKELESDSVSKLMSDLRGAVIVFTGRVKDIEIKETYNEDKPEDTRLYAFVTYEVEEIVSGKWDDKFYTIQCHPACSDCPIFEKGDHDLIFADNAFISGCDVFRRFRIFNNLIHSQNGERILLNDRGSFEYSLQQNPDFFKAKNWPLTDVEHRVKVDKSSGEAFDKKTFLEYLHALLDVIRKKPGGFIEIKPREAKKSELKPTYKYIPVDPPEDDANIFDLSNLPTPKNEKEAKEQEQLRSIAENELRRIERTNDQIRKLEQNKNNKSIEK